MKKTRALKWSAILLTVILAACGDNQMETDAIETSEPETADRGEDLQADDESSSTLTLVDAAGNSVELPENPQSIAVFDNGQLDNLSTLGLSERVVLTASPNLPEHLSAFEEVDVAGSFFEIDLEVTHAAEPDLIIVAGRSSAAYDDLKAIAPTIDLSNDSTDYFSSIESNLMRLGIIFDLEAEAENVIAELNNELEELNEQAEASDLTTLVAMYNEGSLSAYGPGSRFGVVHDAFGFQAIDEGVEESNHGMEITYEYVLEKDPDVLFVIDRTAAIGGDTSSAPLEDNPIIQQTTAYQNSQLTYLSPSAWYLAEGGAGTFRIMMEEVSQVLN
ncbi:MAG: ABC transporter substrate-binding protein [Alkalibacterium sp.]|nr:ABC transporter substrate-binding protein [Alkalibacterium sp.]TVP92398.1 MAG: hypothetical protein EA249_02430 [Alkalibacterium sp.]